MDIMNNLKNLQSNINAHKKQNEDPLNEDNYDISPMVNDTQSIALKTNNDLMNQLRFICDKIEETITQNRNNIQMNQQITQALNQEIQQDSNFNQKITNYKNMAEDLEYKLETVYNLSKIEELESEIKKLKTNFQKVKQENGVLINIRNNQIKGMEEIQNKYDNQKERNLYSTKIKKMKEEMKSNKEISKDLDIKIKEQNFELQAMDEKCRLIRDNIEYKKKQQDKGIQQQTEKVQTEENPLSLEEQINILESTISSEEKQYKTEINNQKDTIGQIKQEIEILQAKIKHKEQSEKIDKLRQKELLRIRKKNSTANTKIRPNFNSNFKLTGNTIKQQFKPNTRSGSRGIRNNGTLVKTYNNTPLFNSPIYKGGKKPFEINKFKSASSRDKYNGNNNPYSVKEKNTNTINGFEKGTKEEGEFKVKRFDVMGQIEDLSKNIFNNYFRKGY